jgi:hypothetical protein
MPGQGLKRWIAAAMCVCLLPWSQSSVAREPPAAGCIDLYDLSGGWRTGERQVLIRSSGKAGARLELDAACPAFAEGVDLETLAAEGWACPGAAVFVRGGGTTCPVIRMSALSPSELAGALRRRDAQVRASVTLDRVEVRGRRHWRDIGGTTDYCVDARFLRGWRKDNEGLVVEVAPRRHAGHRYYRVETLETCPDLASTHSIRLMSRNGGAAVCGRPGDKVVLMDWPEGFTQMGSPPTSAFERGCEISRVTPLPRG